MSLRDDLLNSGFVEKETKNTVKVKRTKYYETPEGSLVAKECCTCREVKLTECFPRNKHKFDGFSSQCKLCVKAYKERNRERLNIAKKQYYEDNREEILRKKKERDTLNRDELLEKKRLYRENNREKTRQYYQNNKEADKERTRKYRLANPDFVRLHLQKRRARERALPHTLTTESISDLRNIQQGVCLLNGSTRIQLEHFIPISWGFGGNTFENCYFMDATLNNSKNSSNPFEWISIQPDEIKSNFYNKLVPMMAQRNHMTTDEFRDYVYWCWDNKRDLSKISHQQTEV